MKYKIEKCYTPDDTRADRTRNHFTLESDSTDVVDIATNALVVATSSTIDSAKEQIFDIADDGQLDDFDPSYIEFTLHGNSGNWQFTIESDES